MTKIIDSLNWRYATKKFDPTKKVSKEDLDEIIETFRLTSSSFGLEPWKLVIVENKSVREKLIPYTWWEQIVGASHVFVLARIVNIGEKHLERMLDNSSEITWISRTDLKWYEEMIRLHLLNRTDEEKSKWAREQVFIALWNMLNTLAQKRIDSCAMWWFDSEKYDEILWLKEKWLASVVVLPIWYRSNSDKYSKKPKVRFLKADIVDIID